MLGNILRCVIIAGSINVVQSKVSYESERFSDVRSVRCNRVRQIVMNRSNRMVYKRVFCTSTQIYVAWRYINNGPTTEKSLPQPIYLFAPFTSDNILLPRSIKNIRAIPSRELMFMNEGGNHKYQCLWCEISLLFERVEFPRKCGDMFGLSICQYHAPVE